MNKGISHFLKFSFLKSVKNKNLKFFSTKYSHDKEEETKVEVDVRIKEDVFDKRIIINEDESTYNSYSGNFQNLNNDIIENATLFQLIEILKSMVKNKNTNFDVWYRAINRFNDLLCTHQVSKKEVIEFLEVLNFFQPKILEKKTIAKDLTNIGSTISFSKRHEDEYHKLIGPKDIISQFALFLKKNIKPNLIKEVIKESMKFENRENIDEGLEDLLGIYDILFRNIEMKILDDIKNGRASYDVSNCIVLISSFSRASEGTNSLYEVLMRKIAKNAEKLSIADIEVIINYLPHDLYNNSGKNNDDVEFIEMKIDRENPKESPETGRTLEISQFYKIIFEKISQHVLEMDDAKFINFFQGILKIKFVDIDIISTFLTNFDLRISKSVKDKKFFFDFLQLFAYFLKIEENKKYLEAFDTNLIFKSIEDPFIKKYINSFDLKEISTIFWLCYHMKILTEEKIKNFETPIKNILIAYLNDPKSKIDTMGYESHTRYYDKYAIEPYDLEALNFFIRSEEKYKGELLDLMQKAMKCIELENTHPISRRWFHF